MLTESARENACLLVFCRYKMHAHMRTDCTATVALGLLQTTMMDLLVVPQNVGDWHVAADAVLFRGQEAVLDVGLIRVAEESALKGPLAKSQRPSNWEGL